jgi:hypothetical protein
VLTFLAYCAVHATRSAWSYSKPDFKEKTNCHQQFLGFMVTSFLQGLRFSANICHFPENLIPPGRQIKSKTLHNLRHFRSFLHPFSHFPNLSVTIKFPPLSLRYPDVLQRIIPINLMARIIENNWQLVR